MIKAFAILSLLSLVVVTDATAEQRLLVTAVPEPGQVEARVDVEYGFVNGSKMSQQDSLTGELIPGSNKIRHEQTRALASIGIGATRGLKLSVSIPYTFSEHVYETWAREHRDGFGDVVLGARFSPGEAVALPFDAAIGIDWKTTSAGNGADDAGTGRNSYAPYLAASRRLEIVVPYVKYQPEFVVKQHRGQTNHSLTIGAEYEFGHHNSLDLAVTGKVNGRSEIFKSSNDIELEMAPYLNLSGNLYLIPRFAYTIRGDLKRESGIPVNWDAHEYVFGLGIYSLF